MLRNRLAGLLAFVCLLTLATPGNAPAQAAAARPPAAIRGFFLSGGKRITVECFEPARPGKYPALVLLHGLDGLEGRAGEKYRTIARRLAEKGYIALLVHYFDRTGTKKEELPALLKQFRAYLDKPAANEKEWQDSRATFEAWQSAVIDAVAHARRHPLVGAGQVGLVGASMGGFLATSVAARPELRIACVAELFGGLPREVGAGLSRMPPTLIVHGEEDRVVPVREAYALRDRLQARKSIYEVHIYKGIGHGFERPDGTVCWLTAWQAERRLTAFLARHLRTTAPAATRPGKNFRGLRG